MRSHRPLTGLLMAGVAVLTASPWQPVRAQSIESEDPETVEAMARATRPESFEALRAEARQSPDGMVRVLVAIHVEEIRELRRRAVDAKDAGTATAADATLAGAIRGVAETTLLALAGTAHAVHRVFKTVAGMSITVSVDALNALEAQPKVITVKKESVFHPSLDDTTRIVGAVDAWASGFDGTGQFVAVLDSGVLTTHEMFAGKTIVEACFAGGNELDVFVGDCPNGEEEQTGAGSAALHPSNFSGFDHGTHVAGIAVGNGPVRDGVARGADLMAIQVFSRHASDPNCVPPGSSCVLAHEGDQIAALQHVMSLRNTFAIAAVNMSLGGGCFSNQSDCNFNTLFIEPIISDLRSAEIATVIAAGNDDCCTEISAPGCSFSAVAVGAADDNDNETDFSNYNVMLDLFAPGESVMSSIAPGNSAYGNKRGTSMAAPHVAGAWAVIRDAVSGASVNRVLEALSFTGAAVNGRCDPTPPERRINIPQAILATQADIWVDFANAGSETGSIFGPYNTLAEGVLFASDGDLMGIKASASSETLTIDKALTVRSFRGTTTIGN